MAAMLALPCLLLAAATARAGDWPHWRGAGHHGRVSAAGSFGDSPFHLAVEWRRDLGKGYSGVSVARGHVVTLFADEHSEFVIALDASDGDERWRYRIGESTPARGGSEGGPASVPAVAGNAVYGLGGTGVLFAVRLEDGAPIWSVSLGDEFGARPAYYGFATSPLVAGELLFVQAGAGSGRSLTAWDRATGALRWTLGDDRVAYQTPVLIRLAGRRQIVAVTEQQVLGLDPASGDVLWSARHGLGGRDGAASPVPLGPEDLLLAGARDAVRFRVRRTGVRYEVTEIWRSRELKASFATPVVHEGFVYGFSAEFLTCLSAADGSRVWRSTPPGGHGLILVDGHLVVLGADGELIVARATPEGYRERARLPVFSGATYTHPSFAHGKVWVRNTEGIAAIRLHPGPARPRDERPATGHDSRFARFVRSVEALADGGQKRRRLDAFLDRQPTLPIVEGQRLVHFVFRGPAVDVAVSGSMTEVHARDPMQRIEGTDFFHRSYPIEPGARWEYDFLVDFQIRRTDPLNPRRTGPGERAMSELVLPGWNPAPHLEPYHGLRPGRMETLVLDSSALGARRTVQVYLPHGYAEGDSDYPLLLLVDGLSWVQEGRLPNSMNHLLEAGMEPLVAAFVEVPRETAGEELGGDGAAAHVAMLADEIVPLLEERYRLRAQPHARVLGGAGMAAMTAIYAVVTRPGVFGAAAGLSVQLLAPLGGRLLELVDASQGSDARVQLVWSRYELRMKAADMDLRRDSRRLLRALQAAGIEAEGREVMDASGWKSWSHHVPEVLAPLFPRPGKP